MTGNREQDVQLLVGKQIRRVHAGEDTLLEVPSFSVAELESSSALRGERGMKA